VFKEEKNNGEYLLLAAVALVALMMRAYGADFGLPLHYHIDEERVMNRVIRMVTTGDLNPHFFHYPSFIFYFLSALVASYYFVHYLPFALGALLEGGSLSLSAFKEAFVADEAVLYLLGRLSMAIVGVLTVVLLFFLVRRLLDRRAALFASAALALSPLHVVESHYIKQEILMTFFMFLALFIAVRGVKTSPARTSLGVGAAAGIAASVKYNGILGFAVVPLLFRKNGKLSLSSFFGMGPLLAAAAAVAAFLLFSPFILFDFGQFSTDFAFEMSHVSVKGHHGFDLNGDGLVYHRFLYQLLAALPFSMGLPLYFMSLAGVAIAVWRKENSFLWILYFGVPYFVITAMMKVVFLRYYMPITVILCITAGYGLSVLTYRKGKAGKLAWFLAAAVLLHTAAFTWSLERHMPRGRATLDEGLEWILENVPEGSRVAVTHFTPPLSGDVYELVNLRPHQFTRDWLRKESPDCLVISSLITVGFERGGVGVEEGKAFLDDLRAGQLGYRRAAFYQKDFMNRNFFARVDPTLTETFMPGIEIILKEGGP